jgi:two-component system, NarL family, sensor histidine kinase DesK
VRLPLPDHRFPATDRGPLRARAGVALGLLFLIGPVADLVDEPLAPAHIAALLVGLVVFVALYLSLLPPISPVIAIGPRAVGAALVALPVIAVIELLAGAPGSFVALFVYFVAAAGMLLPARAAAVVVAGTAIGVAVGVAVGGADAGAVGITALTIVAIGAMMAAFGRLARANAELRATREELARLAVAEERLRIGRDLHDLLGHSLSVIALKSELARKLVEREASAAATELDDIQTVTRTALAEVRDAVQGYRQRGLAEALDGARTALSAAGIDCELAGTDLALPAEVDAVLAWAVREGTTNVIRHSAAARCAIRVRAEPDAAALEIEDDGRAAAAPLRNGSGLAGMRERVQRLRGELEAGARPEGGFRLRLTIPT